jgi:hypothetical protein
MTWVQGGMQEAENPLVMARLAVLRTRFGTRLDESQWDDVARDILTLWRAAEELQHVSLDYADPPMSWLSCRPEETQR